MSVMHWQSHRKGIFILFFSLIGTQIHELALAQSGQTIDVFPNQAGSLPGIVSSAQNGDTIRLADGTYRLTQNLWFRNPGVTLRSMSGNREAVIIDGEYKIGEVLSIQASNTTIADVTVTRAYYHPIHVSPSTGNVVNTLIHNVRITDGAEQFIKINPVGSLYADYGVIRFSHLELTNAGRPYVRNNCYTGGIDAHQARGWQIHDNTIIGFWCNTGLSEHGIHLWTGSRDTVVERNVLINNARGIGFGLGQNVQGRSYPDGPCGQLNLGHYGGIIRNNFVFANDDRVFNSQFGFDAGIALEQSCSTQVLHNTVVSTKAPFSSIEWRFPSTNATITNNLVSHNLRPRDGAPAVLAGNLSSAPLSLFVDPYVTGDLHLKADAGAAINKGVSIPGGLATTDIDQDGRDASPDIGADEYVPAGSNQAPAVNAGPDQTITIPASVTLSGTVSDDGLPNPPGMVTMSWSKVSGPGNVTFSNPSAPGTSASFSQAGTYALRLTASDSALAGSDDVTIVVNAAPPTNKPPVVNAGPSQTITLPASASLSGTASDDGLPKPPGVLTLNWSKVSGPGSVTFGNAHALATTASFSQAGVYVLRLTASDGALSAFSDVTITVNAAAVNKPPVVNAGPSQTIFWGQAANLKGSVTDDGLPNPPGKVTTRWRKVSGPGSVSFRDRYAAATMATFSLPGKYVLKLTASDSSLSAESQTTVTVQSR